MRQETDLDAVRALIRAYPGALHMRSSYHDTPLHLACLRNLQPEMVLEIAEASCIETASDSAEHSGALVSPLLAPNLADQSPIGLEMENFQRIIVGQVNPLHCALKNIWGDNEESAFKILSALTKILYYGPNVSSGEPKSLVRALLLLHRKGVRMDPAFIRRALFLYPEEAKLADMNGDYSLHLEASIPVEKMCVLDAHMEGSLQKGCCSGECHKRMGVLQLLMDIFPDAARYPNNAGQYPLNLVVSNGRPWDRTSAHILRSYPEALHFDNNLNGKTLPRSLARIADGCGASSIYSFIRSRPEVLVEQYPLHAPPESPPESRPKFVSRFLCIKKFARS
jgi:hypothetical protein